MQNVEIEKKYQITKEIYDAIVLYFEEKNQTYQLEKQNDIYFSPIHFPFLGGEIDNECLRIRVLEDKNILSYKKYIPATSKEPSHCIEHELEIKDIEKMKFILEDLRISEVFTLKKDRKSFLYQNEIEIALDVVDQLGYFIELEIVDFRNVGHALEEMKQFISKFGITEEMRNCEGYSYLLFNQKESN